MSGSQEGGGVANAIAVGLVCLVLGGAVGYYTRYFTEAPGGGAAGATSSGPPPAGGMPGMMGGMGGGGGGGGFNQPGPSLARLVRNLDTIQKVQNAGITSAQASTLKPILEQIKSAEKLPEAEAKAKLDALNAALTQEQKDALAAMQPFRGGGGGRGGPGGPGGPGAGGPRGPGGPGAGPMGGGGPGGGQDPEKPFASERNKEALDDLLASLKK